MKKALLLVAGMFGVLTLPAQEIVRELKSFNKIIASPRINVILQKGDEEQIRLVYNDVNKSRINIVVRGRTLRIFLEDAKKVERTYRDHDGKRHGIYEGASVTAYVTYRELESLEIRGNQELTCLDAISSQEFLLRAYGENEITLASLEAEYFRATLYGENKLKINNGKVLEQKYRLFGENKIDTRDLESEYTYTSIYGEGRLKINSKEEVRVKAFGEPQIFVDGGGYVNRRIIIGKAEIVRE